MLPGAGTLPVHQPQVSLSSRADTKEPRHLKMTFSVATTFALLKPSRQTIHDRRPTQAPSSCRSFFALRRPSISVPVTAEGWTLGSLWRGFPSGAAKNSSASFNASLRNVCCGSSTGNPAAAAVISSRPAARYAGTQLSHAGNQNTHFLLFALLSIGSHE
ncbi:hypothetical protein LX32DRAFT_295856 [Colletotrichum zoysiae]|uniref:Uncharacterized protein n=1 Tax=Colletotrichum zoysiae TaxID=1216348 RepID=A0AAD9HN23_9PEZI|nr:hypothetical protein LX32DRAFT_295856 [Colletotrichum zoysiae]